MGISYKFQFFLIEGVLECLWKTCLDVCISCEGLLFFFFEFGERREKREERRERGGVKNGPPTCGTKPKPCATSTSC